jgi:hypothetical protein
MFVDNIYTYLICVNSCSRFCYARNTNISTTDEEGNIRISRIDQKTYHAYLTALQSIIEAGAYIKYLRGDGEKSFSPVGPGGRPTEAGRFYQANNIEFNDVRRSKPVEYPTFMTYQNKKFNKTEPSHTSLSIIDRIILTIRNIAFNMKIGTITPKIMDRIINIYINAPHDTLSEVMGFELTPKMVENDIDLQEEIIRRFSAQNSEIKAKIGFVLPVGRRVVVFNRGTAMSKRRSDKKPQIYTVSNFNGIYYELVGENGTKIECSRLKLIQYNFLLDARPTRLSQTRTDGRTVSLRKYVVKSHFNL